MALLTPPPAAPQRGDRTTFANRVDAFITWLINFVTELISLVANLNSIAAGGAYAIPYAVGAGINASIGFESGGKLAFGNGADNNAVGVLPANTTIICVDTKDIAGAGVSASLASTTSGVSSVIKGHIRLVKQGDPSKWARFVVRDFGLNSALYGTFFVTFIESSTSNPFGVGDAVNLEFQRVGDKGDPGAMTPVLWVRDEKASGTAGGSAAASSYVVRTINTTKKNAIVGSNVASNQILLPAGTYRVDAVVPATGVGQHQAYLYNVTDGVTQATGTSSYAGGTTATTYSVIGKAEFTITGTKTFEIRHWTNTNTASTGLGAATNSGQGEVYTQVFIEKVA